MLDGNRLPFLDRTVFEPILTDFKAGGFTNSFVSAADSKNLAHHN